ncbi:amidohydrolase family protein [Actinopolymorpha alba]|uniref:amidohydrolase family protein n=1 Tax=Actinopolymorpha alba TaxID=533267 RepID=UPI00037F878B|nr:amidohydrolase family protein [Actinopolymorpha alba]
MSITRRRALQTAGVAAVAAGIGLAPGPAASASPSGRKATGRIDTHHHAVPDDMRQWAIARGLIPEEGGPSWVYWTEEDALQLMRDNDIAAAVVSAPVPSVAFADRDLAEEGVRVCNESYAQLVADHPGRFGFFANVAPLHVDLAIDQAAYALDELGADGIILMASAGGRYLGDPAFDRLFAALNERRAVVFVHPDGLPDSTLELPGVSPSLADFLLDTTRAALNLIASGTLERNPDLSIILSHAGGFLPYLAGRAESQGRRGEFVDPEVFGRALRRFYYDTALPASPYAMPTLLKAVGPSQIFYGTDFAARPADEVGAITVDLDRDQALDRQTRHAINRRNALRVFPRLAKRLQ